ncbi:hypothetical protein KUL106_28010 [Alteromonas sp. KUL106]|nr:hypothetical protein KUL106_28010 [Alteromonas sp. KUL106]
MFAQFSAQTPQKTGVIDNNTSRSTIFAANKTALFSRFDRFRIRNSGKFRRVYITDRKWQIYF